MVRIILLEEGKVKFIDNRLPPLEVLLGFIENGIDWLIDYRFLNEWEYYAAGWPISDIKARCLRAILRGRPVWIGKDVFYPDDNDIQNVQKTINEVEEAIHSLIENNYNLEVAEDGEKGVVVLVS